MKITFWTSVMVLFGLLNGTGATAGSEWDIGSICPGQCLYSSLLEKQLPPPLIEQIVGNLSPHLNFKELRPGTAYRFTLDPKGGLQDFTIAYGRNFLNLTRVEDKYAVDRGPMHLSSKLATVRGWYSIATRSIYFPGEATDLSRRFMEILLRDLEVEIDLQEGDNFRLVVEKISLGEQLLRYGTIEAFEFNRGKLHLVAMRYQGEYYDASGRALKSRFLRFPLDHQHISSEFHKNRRHPILGGVRPHRGIDLAAPIGTPVWAIADGEVKSAGWMGGYGRTVVLRHSDGYESLYAHLKKFASTISEGAWVRQKQVIGYIGVTGLSTGPHLHYGLIQNSEPRDPLKEEFPRPLIAIKSDAVRFAAKIGNINRILANDAQANANGAEPQGLNASLTGY